MNFANTMPRSALLLTCVLCALLATRAVFAQGTNHHNPRDPPLGSLSWYNQATKTYQPVTSGSSYWCDRISINMLHTFTDSLMPDPSKPTLVSTVFAGDVFDNSTGVKVGTFQSTGITTVLKADMTMQYLATTGIELGANGDDAIFTQAAVDGANIDERVADLDLAILGGTGQYKGATGDVAYSGTQATKPDNLYVLKMAVPRFKRF